MPKITVMRQLRLKYHIPLRELAQAAEICHQYLSEIELGSSRPNSKADLLVRLAFERIIEARYDAAQCLAKEYANNRTSLLEYIETEESHGL